MTTPDSLWDHTFAGVLKCPGDIGKITSLGFRQEGGTSVGVIR